MLAALLLMGSRGGANDLLLMGSRGGANELLGSRGETAGDLLLLLRSRGAPSLEVPRPWGEKRRGPVLGELDLGGDAGKKGGGAGRDGPCRRVHGEDFFLERHMHMSSRCSLRLSNL
jgi:hypothetical protein